MLDAAHAIQRFTADATRASLENEVLFWALVAQVAMLGEAASRMSDVTRARLSDVPWVEIVGMRNQLIHGYWSIDPDELWRTIKKDIPLLIDALGDGPEA